MAVPRREGIREGIVHAQTVRKTADIDVAVALQNDLSLHRSQSNRDHLG